MMNSKKMFMVVAAIFITTMIGLTMYEQSRNTAAAESYTATVERGEEVDISNVKLEAKMEHSALSNAPLKSDYVMGNEDAPITLVEYASLSCPHCATFHNKVLPKLKKAYIDQGKLRYILRQFPLNESAMAGAMLVHCAGESGGSDRYYQFNNVLFSAQDKWAFDANFKDSLKVFAEVGGVSAGQFEKCLNNLEREKSILMTRKLAGEELKIDGTPFVYLNGHPHRGNKTFRAIQREIEYLLKGDK